jgi:hypothetical protein
MPPVYSLGIRAGHDLSETGFDLNQVRAGLFGIMLKRGAVK